MSKHLLKDQELMKKELRALSEYLMVEYGEIEIFC
jgi:hypothetical protein